MTSSRPLRLLLALAGLEPASTAAARAERLTAKVERERARRQRAQQKLERARADVQSQRQALRAARKKRDQLAERLGNLKPTSRELVLRSLPKHSVGAEIGVFRGGFTEQILEVVQPRCLHLIDPWHEDELYTRTSKRHGEPHGFMERCFEEVQAKLADRTASGQVEIHRAPSDSVAEEFDDGYFDWVYIDGDHSYEAVKRDLSLYLPKARPGGIVAGDDYDKAKCGVQRAVDELAAERPDLRLERWSSQFILVKDA